MHVLKTYCAPHARFKTYYYGILCKWPVKNVLLSNFQRWEKWDIFHLFQVHRSYKLSGSTLTVSLFCPLFDSQWLKSSLHSGPTCAFCCSGWKVNINIGHGSLSRFPDPALCVCSFNLISIFFKVLQDLLLSKVGTLMFTLPKKEMFISRLNLKNAVCLI